MASVTDLKSIGQALAAAAASLDQAVDSQKAADAAIYDEINGYLVAAKASIEAAIAKLSQ